MKTILTFVFLMAITLKLHAQKIENYPAFKVSIEGKGETLFLIPGLSCSGNIWNETIDKFKDTYEIHTFTLAGYAGVKPLENEPILETIKNELIQYIQDHKSMNSIVMGHSIGGFISLLMAIENQKIASKLIIVDSLPFLSGVTNPNITEDIIKSSFSAMKDTYIGFSDDMLTQNLKTTLHSMIRDKSKIDFVLKDAVKSDRRTLGVTAFEMLSNDLRDDIATINIPTLVVTNWNGSIPLIPNGTRASKLQLYKNQYRNCNTCMVNIIDESEHFIMLDNPIKFYDTVNSFINNGTF